MNTHFYPSIKRFLVLTSVLLLLLLASSTHTLYQAVAQGSQTTAFVNVNVIPMDSERVLENYTVIVQDGIIAEIGPADQVTVPAGAQVVEGNGAYLVPGLADMHTHLFSSDRDPGHLILYPAQGSTTARAMSGTPDNLEWRERIEAGELIGPSIYTAGRVPTSLGPLADEMDLTGIVLAFRIATFFLPLLLGGLVYLLVIIVKVRKIEMKQVKSRRTMLVGGPVLLLVGLILVLTRTPSFMVLAPFFDRPQSFVSESPARMVNEVRSQKEMGYDFVKPYDWMTEDDYLAAIAEAKRLGMYVAGHAENRVPLEIVVTSGIDEIAHVDELLSYHWIGYNLGVDIDPSIEDFQFPVDYDSIPNTVALLRDNNVNVVANLSTDEVAYRLIFDTPGVLAGPEYDVVRDKRIEEWSTTGRPVRAWANQGPYRRDVVQPFLLTLTKALHDAGVIVTIGTDTGAQEGCVPSNIHRELELLVEAGFSSYEALEAGTKNAGIIVDRMGRDGSFGTIEAGQRADLLLLEGNPLENVSSTRNRVGVMVRGQWFTQAELDAMVDEFVATYTQ